MLRQVRLAIVSMPLLADPFEYEPSLRLGGRMPHFWIVSDTGKQLSVLDLPRLMMDSDGRPHHIVMTIGAIDHILQKKAEMQAAMANPATFVCIDTPSTPCNAVRFHFYGEKPTFLPPIVAVLMRPDGHIQWFITLAMIILFGLFLTPATSLGLKVGHKAPAFTGESTHGTIRLADFAGKQHVILALYFAILHPSERMKLKLSSGIWKNLSNWMPKLSE
jgi:hypothetical protein